MWFLRYVSDEHTNKQTNRHTDTLIAMHCTHTGSEVIVHLRSVHVGVSHEPFFLNACQVLSYRS